jgi:orotidine-5'-phosphate decarboxylase
MIMQPWERIIVALDVDTRKQALNLVKILKGRVGLFKIGSQLFTAEGPDLVREVVSQGERVFLDLKYHDIPNTVAKAVGAAGSLGVSMLTLHTHGGSKMMKAAVESAKDSSGGPIILLGVTVLTSLGPEDLNDVGIESAVPEQVLRMGMLGKKAGLNGLVSSPQEAAGLRQALGPEILLIIPGIRPAGSVLDDQTRIATPASAVAAGADYLVVGRPITAALDPLEGLSRIIEELLRKSP